MKSNTLLLVGGAIVLLFFLSKPGGAGLTVSAGGSVGAGNVPPGGGGNQPPPVYDYPNSPYPTNNNDVSVALIDAGSAVVQSLINVISNPPSDDS
jgi:hypothetical protein